MQQDVLTVDISSRLLLRRDVQQIQHKFNRQNTICLYLKKEGTNQIYVGFIAQRPQPKSVFRM